MNLLLVFILTGLWHGASWNFLIWGLFHGIFIAAEHAGFAKILTKLWQPIQHVYLLMVVIIAWVFFRSESFSQALSYLSSMADVSNYQTTLFQFAQVLSYESLYAFLIGIILSIPLYPWFNQYLKQISAKNAIKTAFLIDIPRLLLLSALLFFSILKISASTYNPFIYFRF